MEMSLGIVVALIILMVAFLIILALITGWGSEAGGWVDGLFKFFASLFPG